MTTITIPPFTVPSDPAIAAEKGRAQTAEGALMARIVALENAKPPVIVPPPVVPPPAGQVIHSFPSTGTVSQFLTALADAVDSYSGAKGTLKNNKFTGSANKPILGSLTDGGGNSW